MNNFGASTDAGSVCVMNPVGSSESPNPLLLLPPIAPDSVPYLGPTTRARKCANCCSKFPTPAFPGQVLSIGKYSVGVDGPMRTIFEGLQLLFKSRQVVTLGELNAELNDIQLCIPCASQFHNLMICYTTFLQSSKPESYVFKLQKEASQYFKESREIPRVVKIAKRKRNQRCPSPIITPPRYQEVAVSTLPPPTASEIQESSTDLQPSVKPEIITTECFQGDDDTAMNDEDSETNMSINMDSIDDPLYIPSNSTSTTKIAFPLVTPTIVRVESVPDLLSTERKVQNMSNVTAGKVEPTNRTPAFAVSKPITAPWRWSRMQPSDPALPFPCTTCNIAFRRKDGLNRHNREEHGASYVGLTEEQKSLLNLSKFKCNGIDCHDVIFDSFKEWIFHQENEHKVSTGYKWDIENSTEFFPRYIKMRPCPLCGKKCQNEMSTIKHLQMVHFKTSQITCDICGKTVSTKRVLKKHMEIAHSSAPRAPISRDFLCTYCGDSFPNKTALGVHESSHLDMIEQKKKKFPCDVCEKRFDRKYQLAQHNFTHTEERNFCCDQCNGAFKSERLLKSHKARVHYKRFILNEVCELCGKKYAFKNALKEHLMSFHKMDKEEARISAKVRRHSLFRVLPNGDRIFKEPQTKPKSCSICDRTYVRRENLFTHLVTAHGKSEEEAKNITGLETKRKLIPSSSGTKTRKRNATKTTTSENESQDSENDDEGREDEDC